MTVHPGSSPKNQMLRNHAVSYLRHQAVEERGKERLSSEYVAPEQPHPVDVPCNWRTAAIAILKLVAKAYPDEYGAHSALGEAFLIAKDSTAARAELERALALKPGDQVAAMLLRGLSRTK